MATGSSNPDDVIHIEEPKRKIGCVPMAIVAVSSAVACILLGAFFWNLAATQRLKENLDALGKAGYPSSFADFAEKYKHEPGSPGPIWVAAGDALEQNVDNDLPWIGSNGSDPPLPGTPWDLLDKCRTYLQGVAPQLDHLYAAAENETPATYGYNLQPLNPGDPLRLPYMRSHRQACRVLSIAAYVHAHDGDMLAVTKDIHTGLRAAQSLGDEPYMISHLLAVACTEMMCARIRELIDEDFTDEQLAKLQETIREFPQRESLRASLTGESLNVVELLQNPAVAGMGRKEDASFFLECCLPLLESIDDGAWSEIWDAAGRVRLESELLLKSNPIQRTRYAMSASMMPSIDAVVRAHIRRAARLEITDALLAARRFQLREKRMPKDLTELVPDFLEAVPVDPFSPENATLKMVRRGNGICIYSVGINRTDEEGADLPEPGQATGYPQDEIAELNVK